MKVYLTIMLLIGLTASQTYAAYIPEIILKDSSATIINLQPNFLKNGSGKKLTLLQKAQLLLIKHKLIKAIHGDEALTEKQKKQAKWSLILGISSVVLILIPYIGILALPAAIVAIILGAKSLKGNNNKQGLIGVITGSLSILLILLVAALFVAFAGGWG